MDPPFGGLRWTLFVDTRALVLLWAATGRDAMGSHGMVRRQTSTHTKTSTDPASSKTLAHTHLKSVVDGGPAAGKDRETVEPRFRSIFFHVHVLL